MSLTQCLFPLRGQQRVGRNAVMTAPRSHRAVLDRSAGAGGAAHVVSYWPTHPISRAIGGRSTIGSFHNVRDSSNDVSGVGLAREFHQQKINAFTLRLQPSQSRWNSSSVRHLGKVPRMADCKTLGEVTEVASDNLDILTPRSLAAFWTVVPKFLQKLDRIPPIKDDRDEVVGHQMQHQLETILCHTQEEIKAFEYRDLAQTALGYAKIVKNIGIHGRMLPGSPHRFLHDLFIGDNSANKEVIFRHIASTSMPILQKFDARSLSNFIYAYGLAEYVLNFEDGSTFFDALALEAIPKLGEFKPQGLSNMLWAYANVGVSDVRLFENVGDTVAALRDLRTFKPQELSNIVWAYATAEEPHRHLFQKIADHIIKLDNLKSFKPQELSNIVWACATAEEPHRQLFERIADHIIKLDDLGRFKPQALSNIVWSYATANESQSKLFGKVADHIIALNSLKKFKPQELSNLVWAYATAEEPHQQLLEKVADHIIKLDNLGKFKPQELSNLLWAYATANKFHPRLFEKVADHIITVDNLRAFKPQGLSNIVWACATAEEPHQLLFEKVADHIIKLDNLSAFLPQTLSNILWAYATLDESQPKLFSKAADHIVALGDLGTFKSQELSNLVWAYATANQSQQKLFKKVADAAIGKQDEITSQGIANLLWAYATIGQIDQNLFKSFAQTAEALVDECTSQELANLAWVYAVANVTAQSLFNEEFINTCLEKENEFTLEGLSQFHQWNLWQENLKSAIRLPPSLQKKCHDAFVSTVVTPSAFQDDVISQLISIGLRPKEEFLTGIGYRLDALVEVNGNKVGIEIDGPFHFVGRKPTGNTMLKHRQVTNIEGIPIVSVPHWEWAKLGSGHGKKQQYLRSSLGLNKH